MVRLTISLAVFLQPELCQSISKFMAYAHSSVNDMSKVYLANERRYNYTTPKSFLELVSTMEKYAIPALLFLKHTNPKFITSELEYGLR